MGGWRWEPRLLSDARDYHIGRDQNSRSAQYVRMSTDRQRYSIPNQMAAIALYAAEHQLTIVRTYVDEATSGLRLSNRPGLLEMLADVQSGNADFGSVLVFDVSRWGLRRRLANFAPLSLTNFLDRAAQRGSRRSPRRYGSPRAYREGVHYFAAVRCNVVFVGEISIQLVVSSHWSSSICLRSASGPRTIGTVSMTLW